MQRFVSLLVCAFIAWSTSSSAETGFLHRSITLDGHTYRYQVYVPLQWNRGQQWPVMLYLHGAGHRGSDGLSHLDALADAVRAKRERFSLVIVFPQAHEHTQWTRPSTEAMVFAELEQAAREFNGDRQRLYLAGFSMGGAGTLRIAARSMRFAALIDIAGFIRPDIPGPSASDVEADIAENPFLRSADRYATLAQLLQHTPITIFHGDADATSPVKARELTAKLKAIGGTVRYTEFPGVDHGAAPTKAWSDEGLMPWLLAQRRKAGTN
jgi:predicted peptidase